jgi:hypothetical protein
MERYFAISRRQRAGILLVAGAGAVALAMPEAAAAQPHTARPAVSRAAGENLVRRCSGLDLLKPAKHCAPDVAIISPIKTAAKIGKQQEIADSPWEEWAHTPYVKEIKMCESSDESKMSEYNGGVHYSGEYSDNDNFWDAYGGLKYAPLASEATPEQQDRVNYNGYLIRGYEPWQCASEVPR